jgi:hypothetical protein
MWHNITEDGILQVVFEVEFIVYMPKSGSRQNWAE